MDVHVHKTYGYWMLLLQTDVLQHSASMEQEVQRQWGTPELHCVVKKKYEYKQKHIITRFLNMHTSGFEVAMKFAISLSSSYRG